MKKVFYATTLSLCSFAAFAASGIKSVLIETKTLKPTKEFAIVKAVYGAKGKVKDVTEIVQNEVKAKKDIVANNRFGDPAPGVAKKFEVIYSIDGKLKLIRVNEGTTVKLDSLK